MSRQSTGQIEYPEAVGVLFILSPDGVIYAQGKAAGTEVVITYSRVYRISAKGGEDILESYAIYYKTSGGKSDDRQENFTNKKTIDD